MTKFQIGKNGVTEGVIGSLTSYFKNNKTVRISVLKSAERDREKIGIMADELAKRLPGEYKYRIIGFTIVLRRVASLKK